MKRTIYIVRDENGKAWLDEAAFNRDALLRAFVGNWLSRCKQISTMQARQVWSIFSDNGWTIEELQTEVNPPIDN